MLKALAAGGHIGSEPPDFSRRRVTRKRLGAVLAIASALAMGFAMTAAPQQAQAQSVIDGQWTVVHGGTGQVSLNADGTYTSTCEVYSNYPSAWCPAPSGTFQYGTQGSASVTFTGTNGLFRSYRVSGLVSSPDTITSMFGSRTNSPLVMKRGSEFVCTVWSGTGTSFTQYGVNPLVEYDAAADMLYATGSHQPLGSANISNTINLDETAPNYFQSGVGCPIVAPPTYPIIHIASVVDTSFLDTTNPWGMWIPQAAVTIKDAAGAAVAGVSVTGVFGGNGVTCVTGTDGTCTVADHTGDYYVGYPDFGVTVGHVTKDEMTWDGQQVAIALHAPVAPAPTPTPTPVPATHHVGDLDNAMTATSSTKWQPKVTAMVLDANGVAVAGAIVSGTFSHQSGTQTCTTAANGTCTLGNFSLSRRTSSTVFTVTNVVKGSSSYTASANSDPDGDSNGTTMTLKRP
jgi:hypothetical protein